VQAPGLTHIHASLVSSVAPAIGIQEIVMNGRIVVSFAALVLAAPMAVAQEPPWRVTPYLWGAGFDGTVGVPGPGAGLGDRADIETDGYNTRLGGFMLHASYRSGPWVAFGDWTYANFKADSPTPLATLYAGVDAKLKGNIVEAYGGYDFARARDAHLDVFGGVRYYNLDIGFGLREGVLPGTFISADRNWVDGVVGIRWDGRFAERWEAFASADVGAGGSDLSYQFFGGIGYRFGWGSVVGGWRYLHVDYEKSNFKLDAALSGPFLGASFQF
jgi:hypothetical protein